MDPIAATFNDGKTARTTAVTLHIDGHMLNIIGENGVRVTAWPLDEVRSVASAGDGQARRLRLGFKGAERITLVRNEDYQIFVPQCPKIGQTTPRSFRYWKPVITLGALAVVSVFVLIKVIIPAMANQLAALVPASLEDKLGEASEAEFIRFFALDAKKTPEQIVCKGAGGVVAINALAQRLGRQLDSPLEPQITVIDHSLVNAFALPGGRILVFNGLIKDAKNGDDLAGVLAHEIGHQAERHPMVLAFEVAGTSALATLFFGDVSGGALLGGLSQYLLNSGYQRKMERQADNIAVTILNRTDIDGAPLADFFLRLEKEHGKEGGLLSYLSTHPLSKARSDFIRAASTGQNSAMTPQQWASVRNICG